nr:hypothetical protein [Tanacetum cinerariifolium]
MMGELKFFLGLQVHQSPRGIFISQSQYAIELLKKHGLDECVSMSTPMATKRLDDDLQSTHTDQMTYHRMMGGIMYLIASRPDIAYATFVCARYQARRTVKYLKEVKRIFRYLRQSYNKGLWYLKDFRFELISYSDADHAGCKDDCKSTLGGMKFLVIWIRTQLLDYGYKYNRIPMYCDSKSSIAISCNLVQHSNTKHIDIRYHFIKEHVKKGTVELYFIGTEYQLADLFTKALPKERFEYLVYHIVIIMAHQKLVAEVHPDELCPPNKQYDLMDANKKIDLKHVQCPSESKILTNIIKNHPKELSLTLDDFSTIFHLPQATDNNHDHFVPPPSFYDMIPFYKNHLGFTMELKTPSSIKTTGRYKGKVGMKSPDWMIIKAMKQTEHYRMYAEVLGIDVPLIQSQTTESTQEMHRTPSAPRSPTPKVDAAELTPVLMVDKADELILQDTLQEIEKMVEGQEHVVDDSLIPRNGEHNILSTRRKGKNVEESRITSFPTPIRSPRIHTDLVSSDTEKLQELTVRNQVPVYVAEGLILERQKTKEEMQKMIAKAILQERGNIQAQISLQIYQAVVNAIPSQVDTSIMSHMSRHILHVHHVQPQTTFMPEQQYQLTLVVRPRDQDDPRDDAHLEGEKSAKRQKTSEYVIYVSGESSSRYDNEQEQGPLTLGNQEKADDYDFWTDSYASDDDEIPTKQVSQDIMEEIHKFCDATLNRVLEGLKSYNNDVKYSYIQRDLTKDEVEYLKLFEEEIEDRLKN